jgi:hypothetical protein
MRGSGNRSRASTTKRRIVLKFRRHFFVERVAAFAGDERGCGAAAIVLN